MAKVTEVIYFVTYDGIKFNTEREANTYELNSLWDLYGSRISADIIRGIVKRSGTKNKVLFSLAYGSKSELLIDRQNPITILSELMTNSEITDVFKEIIDTISKAKEDLKYLQSYHRGGDKTDNETK
jgi:hypothetical protein